MPDDAKIGVLAIMKDEEMNIQEWLDHYFWIGVDSIFLIDNGSSDRSIERAKAHESSGKVDILIRPERHRQGHHYREAYQYFQIKNRADWLIMADLDEFWFVKNGANIKNAIANYECADLIYTNWTLFGSSGLIAHPASIRKSLIMKRHKLAGHENTKWICRTSALGADQIYTHKVRDIDSRRVISDNVDLQLNHYVIQSREYFEKVKMIRGDASSPRNDATRDWSYFERLDSACNSIDTTLRDLISGQR